MIQSTARTIEGTMKQAVVDPDWDDAAIMHGVMDDVAMNMRRVRSHDLEYLENAIELYHWYAGVRVNAVRQMHVLSPHVAAVSPAQSIRMIRAVSKVDFRMRVTGALQERIIRLMKDTGLSSIPSPDAPWMPSHWPMSLRLINQGVRSTVDQYLIRRMMSHRQSWRRQRVVPTMDFVKLSADPRALERVKSWFAGSSLNTDYYIRKVQRRADMSAWPIGNIDIVAPANVAILSRYCR